MPGPITGPLLEPLGQLARHQLADMTPDQILAAKAAGQLDDLLGITTDKEH